MIFYGFYCMILSITAYSKVKSIKEEYLSIVENFELDPIYSISVVTSSCAAGEENLFTYNW